MFDFDATTRGDPHQGGLYVRDTFNYYRHRESVFRVPDYLSAGSQPNVSPQMRTILVDWMVEVQESFELNHETLYTGVKMVDLYLSRASRPVPKTQLQLIGATALLIACKIDERIPPLLDDFVYVCDDAYPKEEIVKKELEMIRVVDFDVGYPLSYRFLRRYGRVSLVTPTLMIDSTYMLLSSH